MPKYYYSSTAGSYTLVGAVSDSATLLTLNSVGGLPVATPFKVVLEPGQPTEEIVKVTNVAGTSLTVVRGWDGTAAVAHAAAVQVRHMVTAEDFALSRAHEDATAAHGVSGDVVGTSDTQALSNKDLTSGTNTWPTSLVTQAGTQTLTNKDLTSPSNVFPASLVTLSGAQTLLTKIFKASGTNQNPIKIVGIPGQSSNHIRVTDENDVSLFLVGPTGKVTASDDVSAPNITAMQTDVNALKADSGILNSGVATAVSGFSIAVQQATKKGSVAMVYLRGTRTGATIPGSTSGDINNVNVATLSNSAYFPRVPVSGTTVADGQGIFFSIWTDGTVFISALGPGTDLASGAGWSVAATYLV